MLNLNTPVKEYNLKGRKILVKRDDLMGDGYVLPPWGKMSGINKLLDNLNSKYPLIHLAVNGSWSGWALSYLCKQKGIKFIYAYPPSKTYSEFILNKAKENTGNGKPIVILLHTEMGNGVDFMMGTHKWHGSAPNDEQLANALSQNAETLGDY